MRKYLSYILIASVSLTSVASATKLHSPRGDDLDLETNAYYSIGVKNPTQSSGYVTYTNKRSPSGYYAQLATKEPEKYGVGKEYRGHALWRFYETEVPNYYSVGVYRIGDTGRDPNVYLTYSDNVTRSGNGNYMQVADSNLQHFAPGGKWRDEALWGIYPSETSGFFTLAPKSLPNGYMSTCADDTPGGTHLQVFHKQNLAKCQPGGEWRDDVLWKFWKVSLSDVEGQTPTQSRKLPIIVCPFPNQQPYSFPRGPIFQGQANLGVNWPHGGGNVNVSFPGGQPNVNVNVHHQWQF